jgi:diphosphomevalonate decarboxylase
MYVIHLKRSFMEANVHKDKEGHVAWACPSNIAIVKYWGKRPNQIPMNPSLSLTLEEAHTQTRIRYRYHPKQSDPEVTFRFEGKENPTFRDRVAGYIRSLYSRIPVLAHTSLDIDSLNTFPHSSGIASSASAFGALALCLAEIATEVKGDGSQVSGSGETPGQDFLRESSELARLGSGSACRSVYGGFALWGSTPAYEGSTDSYAIGIEDFHERFRNMRDSILIVEKGQKKVSSSAGHGIMETNPYADERFGQARRNTKSLAGILVSGDWQSFIDLMEEEALSLHAMMMTGKPGYMLMQPGTLSIIHRIRSFRQETGINLGFTLDAGANVHVLFDGAQENEVRAFIDTELLPYCQDNMVIHDRMGAGAKNLKA